MILLTVSKILMCSVLAGTLVNVSNEEVDNQDHVYQIESEEQKFENLQNTITEEENFYSVKNPIILKYQDEMEYKREFGITSKEMLKMYDDYVRSEYGELSKDDYYSVEFLEEFADEAVRKGIIDDTPVQRAAITKALLRASMQVVADCGNAMGYTTAAALLSHSLQDNPSNLSYGYTSSYATQIQYSSECNSIVNSVKSYVRGRNISYYSLSSSTTLNSTTDLFLSYNKVNYEVTARRVGKRWNLTIVFTDRYDFEIQAWSNSMTDNNAVTIMNNYAAMAQSMGAIVPYNISVTVS